MCRAKLRGKLCHLLGKRMIVWLNLAVIERARHTQIVIRAKINGQGRAQTTLLSIVFTLIQLLLPIGVN